MGNTSKRSRCKYCNIPITNYKKHLSWCKNAPTGISKSKNTTPSVASANNPPSNIHFQIHVDTNTAGPDVCTNKSIKFSPRMTRNVATHHKIHGGVVMAKETSRIPFPHDLASRLTIDSTIAHRDPTANDSEFYDETVNKGNGFLYSSIQDSDNNFNNDNDDSLSESEIIDQSYSDNKNHPETPSISTSLIDPLLAHNKTV
jgi:hypothetical protein